ncbi:MAG: hypothetical protein HY927_01915 [Elusimicrobia bacterium]|nr:hypothetical protein [Elusimicrobiota bacterium]
MSDAGGRGLRKVYGGLVVAVFAGLAFWRIDLLQEAFLVTLRQLEAGGTARLRVLAEIALFSGILALTWRVIPRRVEPARDLPAAVLAVLAGWAVEAWGTRQGLWSYYTGEQPPLWIIPAWPLGAVVISRLADSARSAWGAKLSDEGHRRAYALLSAACLAVFALFAWPWHDRPQTWAALAALLLAVAAWPDPRRDFWLLAAGVACVFLADLWGTTNNCWRYHAGRHADRALPIGIAFGMAFDSLVVLGCLKGALLCGGSGAILRRGGQPVRRTP